MADDSKPVYIRLREIISASILDGMFRDGDMLPSVRAFAAQQGANPLTVAKAYQSFQDDGLVTVKRGVGMFVADGATRRLRALEKAHFLEKIWPPVAAQMRRIGVSLSDLSMKQDA
jgi:GntR family transcriptional regulator